jgi:hypothetical protein
MRSRYEHSSLEYFVKYREIGNFDHDTNKWVIEKVEENEKN